MTEWRYLAQNILTRQIVHTDLPLTDVEITGTLSGPGGIDATIAPQMMDITGPDGRRVFEEWATMVYAEKDGQIQGHGIFVGFVQSDEGNEWKIDTAGFTAYPNGIPFTGSIKEWAADPFDLVRKIWDEIQSFPDGDLGVRVSQAKSPVPQGPPEPPPRPKKKKSPLKPPKKGKKPKRKKDETDASYNARVAEWEQTYLQRRAAYQQAREDRKQENFSDERAGEFWDLYFRDDKPYELHWWDTPDCGQEIDSLATQIPFEYRERAAWNADHTDVDLDLDLAQPGFGRRRTDLRFAIGENVAVVPDVQRDGDYFANTVIALGKGEGKKMLRAEVGQRDQRLRRPHVLSRKDVGNGDRLRALAEAEHIARAALSEVTTLVVFNHANAPLGSWQMGDEIGLQFDVGLVNEFMWLRVAGQIVKPDQDDRIVLNVVNAEKVRS